MTVWLDVTTLLGWDRPPVGIVRTELELARHVRTTADPSRMDMCVYNRTTNEFRRLSTAQRTKIDAFLNGERSVATQGLAPSDIFIKIDSFTQAPEVSLFRFFGNAGRLHYSVDPIENENLRGWVSDAARLRHRFNLEIRANNKVVYSTRCDKFRVDLKDANILDGNCAFEIPIADLLEKLHQVDTDRLEMVVSGKKQTTIAYLELNRGLLGDHFERKRKLSDGAKVILNSDDVYLTAGLDWDNKDFKNIYREKTSRGFKVAGFCYDLIPVKYPQWCVADVASFFTNYFVDLSWCADRLFCISKRSQADYIQFSEEAGCKVPSTSTIRLGSNFIRHQSNDTQIAKNVRDEVQEVLKSNYILYVSTIERRKNHEVLYRAYTRLVDVGVKNLPRLVFVGMHGWGIDELLGDIANDPRTKDLMSIMNHVTDEELSSLYARANFTVFPSLYEGWGLPVAEALSYGKFCLCSNQGSLPEIAGDLLDYLDPWDVQRWADSIRELVEDPLLLEEKEDLIRTKFKPDRWIDCVSLVFETIEQDRLSTPPISSASLQLRVG